MSKKLLSVLLALMLVLGCTVMAGAETVTAKEEKMEAIAEAVIETLPEDMQEKEYVISEGEALGGENRALVATEDCTAQTIQGLIDDGYIQPEDVDLPEGVTVKVKELTGVTPFIEDDNGEYINALSDRSITSSGTISTEWYSDTSNSYYTVYGRAYIYYYNYNTGSEMGTAYRPVTFYAKYTSNTSNQPTELIATYGHPNVYKVSYPGYLNGTSTTKTYIDYTAVGSTSNPVAGTTYSYSTGMTSYCLITNTATAPGMNIKLYINSSVACEGDVTFLEC